MSLKDSFGGGVTLERDTRVSETTFVVEDKPRDSRGRWEKEERREAKKHESRWQRRRRQERREKWVETEKGCREEDR